MKLRFYNGTHTFIINLELKNKDNKEQLVFSASGTLYRGKNCLDRFCISAGQNLDDILEFIKTMDNKKDIKKLLLIHDLWKKYHLNDMHADCEHAINEKEASKKVIVYEYSYKGYLSYFEPKLKQLQNNKILKDNIKFNKACKIISKYRYSFKTTQKPPKKVLKYYKLKNKEVKTLGWVNYDKDLTPNGILCKPCPICGYKYGTSWNYRPIPQKDLLKIKKLLKGE